MEGLKLFCGSPTYNKWSKLSEDIKSALLSTSKYCIDNKKGDITFAKKIRTYSILEKKGDTYIDGVKALLLSASLIKKPEFQSIITNHLYPLVEVHRGDDIVLTFSYNTELPNRYVIRQTDDKLGMDKELLFFYPDFKKYIIESYRDNDLVIDKIIVRFDEDRIRKFYKKNKGVIWNKSKMKIKTLKKDLIKKEEESKLPSWECNTCLLVNKGDDKKCIACGTPKNDEVLDKVEVKIFDRYWNIEDTKKYKDYLFIYGDNDMRIGKGGQAIIRGTPNSYGLRTKKKPDNNPSSFYTDNEYNNNIQKIDEDIDTILRLVKDKKYKGIIISKDGLGTGLSNLQQKAPKTLKYIEFKISTIKK